MARTSLSKISLLATGLFFTMVFGVTDDNVTFARKWDGEFFGSGAHSTDHPGPVAGLFAANTEENRDSVVIANDDDDDDGDDDDSDNDDGDDDDDDNDSDDDDDDGNQRPVTTPTTPDDDDDDGDDDDDDNDSDDDDDDNDSDDDDDGRSGNLVSSVRKGSLLKEVKANPTLARGAAERILKAGGARPVGSASVPALQEKSSTTRTSSYLLNVRVSVKSSTTPTSKEMSSTTQSSYIPGGRVSDPSYFLAERDANGNVQFTFKRTIGSTVSTLSTTDQDVSSRRADDLASGWKGVEAHKDATDGIFNWDAYTDSQGNADADYLSLGSWLFIYKDSEDGSFTGSYALGVAAGGNDPFDNANLAGLTGTATYRGPATGLYMTKADAEAVPVFDYFDARANLSVDFGDATALGTVSGTVSGGRTDGGVSLPALTLGSADITGSALGGNFDGDTSGVTGDGVALSGKWGGKFFGNRADPADHPGSAAGTFGANTADNLQSIIGAFGAKRTTP